MAIIVDITFDDVLHWSVCVFCERGATPTCQECMGTGLEAIPWAELFKDARVRLGPCGGPSRVHEWD